MGYTNFIYRASAGATALLIFAGCGMQGPHSGQGTNVGFGFPVGTSGTGGTGSSGGTGGTPITGTPVYDYTLRQVGYNATYVTVQTRSTLKVTFTPGVQDRTVAGTGFMPQYSKLGVYITVNGNQQQSAILSNGLQGGSPQTSAVLDFSSSVPAGCATSASECSITITIDHPNYDYWCLNYGSYCPWTSVYQTHPWNGDLKVQTSDTDAL